MVEAVREGFLLHYGTPRLLDGHDPDLALLAGDYLYALGIEQLASLGDSEAVLELSEVIALAAESEAEPGHEHSAGAVAGGGGRGRLRLDRGRTRRRSEAPGRWSPTSAERLWEAAAANGEAPVGLSDELRHAAETLELPRPRLADG